MRKDGLRLKFEATPSSGEVSAILVQPPDARWLYVLGHGAGAGMTHPFLDAFAGGLWKRGIATFRYQFPYMEQGRRAPNPRPALVETVRSAVRAAADVAPGLRLVAGGKSMGGRMTSLAFAERPLENVEALAFLGFPLHAPGKDSADRGTHLHDVGVPMLFLQGTRDKLAKPELLEPLLESVGTRAHIHVLEGGDHSFKTLKSSGRTGEEVMSEAIQTLGDWIMAL